MPTLFWLNIVALSITAVLATSLMLMVLGSGPRRPLNQSFALFALAMAAEAVFNGLRHLALWLEIGDPLLLTELLFPSSLVSGTLLLTFSALYLGRRSRWTDLATGVGLVLIAGLCVPLFRHQLFANVYLDAYGIARTDSNMWRVMSVQLATVYNIWALVLFWQERRRIGEPYLGLGVLVLVGGYFINGALRPAFPVTSITNALSIGVLGYGIVSRQLLNPLRELNEDLERQVEERTRELREAYAEVERKVDERTADLEREIAERERAQEENLRLQQEVIEAQRQAIQELSTPIIPIMDNVIVAPVVGSIDTMRARDIMRSLLAGIEAHRARVVILDITGVPIVDSGVADHLNKAIQAAQLKGARIIVTGISDVVAEAIVDLGIDWRRIETLPNLQTGLVAALTSLGTELTRMTG